ncbi:sugar ABC transporter substrate-binding protein [Bradyrhizobium erythrophlei]|uniref:sugar ABC transporter substrate-binding protein n=1 Tax=Bradyrhizobium erythrophlei TaxID=1437360 RepID=UPI0035EF73AF
MKIGLHRRTSVAATIVAISLSTMASPIAFAGEKILSEVTSLENEYYSNWDRGGKAAAEALGYEYVTMTNGGDPSKQLSNFEAAISAGTRLFFGVAQSTGNIRPIVEKVAAAGGYYVGAWDTLPWFHPLDVSKGAYAPWSSPDDSDAAYRLAVLMFKKIGGKGDVVHITGFAGSNPDTARNDGFDRALKEFPGIKVIVTQTANWNQDEARKVMDSIIIAHPKFNAVFGQNDSVAIGAMQACEEAGIQVPIVGLDGNAETLKFIKEGRLLATASFTPEFQAGWTVVKAYDVAHGWRPDPIETMMFTGTVIVTAANVDTYSKWLRGGLSPFDWKKMSRTLHPDDWDIQYPVTVADPLVLWNRTGIKRPEGYELPKAYLDAVAAGRVDAINKLYAAHYKTKIPQDALGVSQ